MNGSGLLCETKDGQVDRKFALIGLDDIGSELRGHGAIKSEVQVYLLKKHRITSARLDSVLVQAKKRG